MKISSALSALPSQIFDALQRLRETLQLRLSGEFKRFTDEEVRAGLTLVAGPGVVWEPAFGNWGCSNRSASTPTLRR